MLEDEIIQPLACPWASPIAMIKKKNGSLTFCVDYQKLHKMTKKDVYPLPDIGNSLDRLRHAFYFSSMNLNSRNWKTTVDEQDFNILLRYSRRGLGILAFGLSLDTATFSRMMDTVVHVCSGKHAWYL